MKVTLLLSILFVLLFKKGQCQSNCKDFKRENRYGRWVCNPNNLGVGTKCSFQCSKVNHTGALKISCGDKGEWVADGFDGVLTATDLEFYMDDCEGALARSKLQK